MPKSRAPATTRKSTRKAKAAPTTFVQSAWNGTRKMYFGCLSAGWFSATPDEIAMKRSLRTNNPGALNDTKWQHGRDGYVGKTKADAAGNETAIYATPEFGVATWYHLVATRYGYGAGRHFIVADLARRYAGATAPISAVEAYIKGWKKWSNGAFDGTSVVHLLDDAQLASFAKALFAHESADHSPLLDSQLLFGFALERAATPP